MEVRDEDETKWIAVKLQRQQKSYDRPGCCWTADFTGVLGLVSRTGCTAGDLDAI